MISTSDELPGTNHQRPADDPRIIANRANALLSTGPRTEAGKQRSSMNAVKHGLTASSPVLPTEDRAAFEQHRARFFDEYKPATPTETQLVEELVDTSWRLNRVPLLEAALLARAADVPPESRYSVESEFDIFTATHRLLGTLSLQSGRLSRQFNKALTQLREIQADRAERERRDLKDAAVLFEFHKHKGLPFKAANHGFVFSEERIKRFADRLKLLNGAKDVECAFSDQPPNRRHRAASH